MPACATRICSHAMLPAPSRAYGRGGVVNFISHRAASIAVTYARDGNPATCTNMSVAKRHLPAGTIAAMVASLMLAVPYWAAAQAAAPHTDGKAYVRPGHPVARPLYVYPGACLYGACVRLGWADRRPLRRPVAPEQAEPAEQDIWGTTGSPWGYVRRLPPPTPESHIQPRYRDASTLRPEFAERGDGTVPN
jgi:hypothetical protein